MVPQLDNPLQPVLRPPLAAALGTSMGQAPLAGPATWQKSLSFADFRGGNILVSRGNGNFLYGSGSDPAVTSAMSMIGLYSPNVQNDSSAQDYWRSKNGLVRIYHDGTTRKFGIQVSNNVNGDILLSPNTFGIEGADSVFCAGIDSQTTGAKRVNMSQDGQSVTPTHNIAPGTDIGHTISWTENDWSFGASVLPANQTSGMIACQAVYNVYIDWSTNRSDWWDDVNNCLKDPGPDGSGWTASIAGSPKPISYHRLFQGEPITEFFKNRAHANGDYTLINAAGAPAAPYTKLNAQPTAKYKFLYFPGNSFVAATGADTPAHGIRRMLAQLMGRADFHGGVGGQQLRKILNDPYFSIEGRAVDWMKGVPIVTYLTPGVPASGLDLQRSNPAPIERRSGGFTEFGSPKYVDGFMVSEGDYNDTHGSPFIVSKGVQGDYVSGAALCAASHENIITAWKTYAPNPWSKNQYIAISSFIGGQAPSDASQGNNVYLANFEEYGGTDPTKWGTVDAGHGPGYNAIMAMIAAMDASPIVGPRHFSPYKAWLAGYLADQASPGIIDPIDLLPLDWVKLITGVFGSEYTAYLATLTPAGVETYAAADAYDVAHGVIPSSLRSLANVGGVTTATNKAFGIHPVKYGYFAYLVGVARFLRQLGFISFTGIPA